MHLRIIAVCSILALLCGPAFRAADTLPASIPDAQFTKMIADFSEPGGSFIFEMYMSNEETYQTILPELLNRVFPGGVYLGVAPEQNFTYISALRPKLAFIVDIRRENMIEHLMYKSMFELSATRAEFLSKLFARSMPAQYDPQTPLDRTFVTLNASRADNGLLNRNLTEIKNHVQKTHGFPLTASDSRTIDYILNSFAKAGPDAHLTTYGTTFRILMMTTDGRERNRNFLASDASYQFVRQMQQKNLIVPVVGDFAGPKALRAIAAYLRAHNAEVSTFYVSNVEEYIESPRSVWNSYCGNIAALPVNSSSMFIRFGRGGRGSFLGAPMQAFTRKCVPQ